jgi:hypothetical protein
LLIITYAAIFIFPLGKMKGWKVVNRLITTASTMEKE